MAEHCLTCRAPKADHIYAPGRPLLCPRTEGGFWAPALNLNTLTPTQRDPNNFQTNRAIACLRDAYRAHRRWQRAIQAARREHGDGNGVLVSGIYRDHFPADVKDALRALVDASNRALCDAQMAWRQTGRTTRTFRLARKAAEELER